jgi:hypothetical protein
MGDARAWARTMKHDAVLAILREHTRGFGYDWA